MPFVTSSFLLLVARMLLVAMPGALGSDALAPNSSMSLAFIKTPTSTVVESLIALSSRAKKTCHREQGNVHRAIAPYLAKKRGLLFNKPIVLLDVYSNISFRHSIILMI